MHQRLVLHLRINRIIMEFKLCKYGRIDASYFRINRIIMEFKFIISRCNSLGYLELIES